MVRKVSVLCVVAIAAGGVFAAVSLVRAAGGEISAEKYPATLTGTQIGASTLTFGSGLVLTCDSGTSHATLTKESQELDVSSTSKSCHTNPVMGKQFFATQTLCLNKKVTIIKEEVHYCPNLGEEWIDHLFEDTAHITPPCTLFMGRPTLKANFKEVPESNPKALTETVTGTVKTLGDGTFPCGSKTKAETATFEAKTTWIAEEKGSGKQIGLEIT